MDDRATWPIGFFDSGAGGLTVLKSAAALLPHEHMIYYGDSANAPYGQKSAEEILSCTLAAVDFLIKRPVKALVLACNTATSAAASALRARLGIPVVGMEPALKPAAAMAKGARVAVLATQATLSLPRFRQSMNKYGQNAVAVPAYGLVELIEDGITSGPRVEACLSAALSSIAGPRPEVIVLGCTHYPFVRREIARLSGGAKIIDGNTGTARQLARVLEAHGLAQAGRPGGGISFYSSLPGRQMQYARLYSAYNAAF